MSRHQASVTHTSGISHRHQPSVTQHTYQGEVKVTTSPGMNHRHAVSHGGGGGVVIEANAPPMPMPDMPYPPAYSVTDANINVPKIGFENTTTHAPSANHHSGSYQNPNVTVHVPSSTGHAPSVTHHAPSATHHAPSVTHHAPSFTHHAPSVTHHAPSSTRHVPFRHEPSVSPRNQRTKIEYSDSSDSEVVMLS